MSFGLEDFPDQMYQRLEFLWSLVSARGLQNETHGRRNNALGELDDGPPRGEGVTWLRGGQVAEARQTALTHARTTRRCAMRETSASPAGVDGTALRRPASDIVCS